MIKHIRKIQLKSEETRKQIFVASLIVCMSFVGIIWISSLGYKFGKETVAKTEEGIKPFALFSQSISNTYNNITASIGKVKTLKNEETVRVEDQKQIEMIPVEIQSR